MPLRADAAAAAPAMQSNGERMPGVRPSVEDLAEVVVRLENTRAALGEASYRVSQLVQANLLLERHAHALVRELDHTRRLALHDSLTGLPNRTLLADRVELAILHARRESQRVAVLMLDLDGFKVVNDCYGHATGDTVLCEVSRRALASIRSVDTACRFGGDEFVIVLTDIATREDAQAVVEKIRSEIARPMEFAEWTLSITASVGLSVYPSDGSTCDALLDCADREMYRTRARRGAAEGQRLLHAHVAHDVAQNSPHDGALRSHTATAALMCGSAT